PVPSRVDEPGIAGAEILDTETESLQRGGAEAREEDVRLRDELEQQLAPGRLLDVDPDAALAAVVLVHREVGTAGAAPEALGAQAAHRIALPGVLDLDHVGAEGRHERSGRSNSNTLR